MFNYVLAHLRNFFSSAEKKQDDDDVEDDEVESAKRFLQAYCLANGGIALPPDALDEVLSWNDEHD